MEQGAHTTYVAYRLEPDPLNPAGSVQVTVRLLTNFRDHHGRTESGSFTPNVVIDDSNRCVVNGGGVELFVKPWHGSVQPEHAWVENFDLVLERERGLQDRDNHF